MFSTLPQVQQFGREIHKDSQINAKKANKERTHAYIALTDYRNTPVQGHFPDELLFAYKN